MALENPLWSGVCELYAKQGVAEACLALQDQGFSVNLLLTCIWCGTRGHGLVGESYPFAQMPAVAQWRHQATESIRQARYSFKPLLDAEQCKKESDVSTMYEELKRLELQCEQIEISLIYKVLQDRGLDTVLPQSSPVQTAKRIRENLATYLNAGKLSPDFVIPVPANVLIKAVCG